MEDSGSLDEFDNKPKINIGNTTHVACNAQLSIYYMEQTTQQKQCTDNGLQVTTEADEGCAEPSAA